MFQCPKISKLHVNFKVIYDPIDNEKCFRTKKIGQSIPIDSKITKRQHPPSLEEMQAMIEHARISGTREAKAKKYRRRK